MIAGGIRLGIVDDHPAIAAGVLAGLAGLVPLAPGFRHTTTVDELIASGETYDVVILDIRLQDGSDPPDNARRLTARGWKVLLLTQVRQPALIGRCMRAGALGIVGKHEDLMVVAEAVVAVASGQDYVNADWAAALAAVAGDRAPALAPREDEVLRLYAAGLPMKSVARRLGVGEETVKEYLTRIRRKYLDAGRPARTKTDLYIRAVEDGLLPPTDT